MRPSAGDDALGRPRVVAEEETLGRPEAPKMTFFFADESTVGSSSTSSPNSLHRPSKDVAVAVAVAVAAPTAATRKQHPHQHQHPTVAAAPDNAPAPAPLHTLSHNDLEPREGNPGRPPSSRGNTESPRSDGEGIPSGPGPVPGVSRGPLTPPLRPSSTIQNLGLNFSPGPSGPASALSSVSSRRGSFTGSLSEDLLSTHTPSLAGGFVGGGVEDVDVDREPEPPASMMDSGSAPQLIMPSIKMPSRRPFTAEGQSMGRLKVLIAGDSGVGKTSLIKAIVQSCEHIVHVDPITPPMTSSTVLRSSPRQRGSTGSSSGSGNRRLSRGAEAGTSQITEIYASTKPYPEWWSEIDDFRVLQRRKRLGNSVLDRNICFVDTPGYGSGSSSMDTITPVTDYIEGHLRRMSSNALSDGDTLNLVGGEGGIQVDVVFYMVSNRLRPVDIQYLRQVAPLTNVVLLVAQSDLMSPEQIRASKEQISSQLREAKIRPFSFTTSSGSPSPFDPTMHGLYAISSATGSDHDTMDASLLMSPDYIQPLISTELATLVQHVFSQNGASWLRHSAARKYVQWRNSESSPGRLLVHQPLHLSRPQPPPYGTSHGQVLTSPMGPASSYALARITDHTQREERLAQVRLANWASDLQKSLANERAQYAALARGERAVWLTEKLNECVQEGTLVPLSGRGRGRGRSLSNEKLGERIRRKLRADAAAVGRGNMDGQAGVSHQDPLGLLQVAAELRRKSLVALEVLGSLGLLGGLMVWASKHYWHLQAYEWVVGEWDRFWGTGR